MPKKSTVRTQPNNIDTLCKAQKKTQREIAQKINFTEGYIAMVKRGKVSCVSMEFVEKLAAVLETQPEKIFPDYECSRQQAKENVRECRNGQAAGLKEAESRTQRIADKSGGQQPEDKFNVRTEPNHIADWCAIRGITQKELAELAGMGQTQVADIKRGTYVLRNKLPHDLVIDLDYICAALMGESGGVRLDFRAVLPTALEVRKLLYQCIQQRRGKWERAFIVTATADALEMRRIAQELNAELVLMDTTLKECLERIRNDPQRNRSRRKFERLAIEWHEKYSKSLEKPFIPPNLTN
jgi:transcriptional regulator with XRE-family HTH domain